MNLRSPQALYGALSWHVRGVFATERVRELGFAARGLLQPAEVEARRGMARELAAAQPSELHVDRSVGHLRLPASAIPDVDEVCRVGNQIGQGSTTADGSIVGSKDFFRFRVASDDERLPIVRFALDPRILAMVSRHFGVLPVLFEADYFCSFPTPEGPWSKSQLWHCDDDAAEVLKIFVYCHDVGPEDGPFEFIEADTSRRVREAVGYRYAGRRYRVSDETMLSHARPSDVKSVEGPRGTAFVTSTAKCFHRGSRIRSPQRRRIAALIGYVPPSAQVLPARLARGAAPLAKFARHFHGDVERAVLGQPAATKWL